MRFGSGGGLLVRCVEGGGVCIIIMILAGRGNGNMIFVGRGGGGYHKNEDMSDWYFKVLVCCTIYI